MIKRLENYKPRTADNITDKEKTSAKKFYKGRKMIINAFKNKLFPFYSGNYYEELEEESEGKNEESSEREGEIPDIGTSEEITMLDFFTALVESVYILKKNI